MTPHYYTYENPDKQSVYYRGYVKQYTDSPTVIIHTCTEVHKNKYKALDNAKKLIKTLKSTVHNFPTHSPNTVLH